MLKLLSSISPLAVLLIGAVPAAGVGSAVGWFARGVVFDRYERPAIIQSANDAATIRVMEAANSAEDATRALLQRQYDEAFRMFRQAIDSSQQAAAAAQTHLDERTAAYEMELAAAGRSCPVTQRDLEWVRGDGTQ